MERSRSGEDVTSSDESDPERHMSDNSGSTKPETESNKPETESNLKNVMVLLRRDVHKNDGKVYTPNAKEMTQLKRPEKEQYKTGIKLTWNMTEKNVDEELRRRFPILGNNGR